LEIPEPQKISVSDQVLCQKVGDETVLLDLASEQYFGLDEVGTRFWELLSASRPFDEIVKVLADEYEASEAHIELDLKELLLRLAAEGLVSVSTFDR
jgi:hypothetical protein